MQLLCEQDPKWARSFYVLPKSMDFCHQYMFPASERTSSEISRNTRNFSDNLCSNCRLVRLNKYIKESLDDRNEPPPGFLKDRFTPARSWTSASALRIEQQHFSIRRRCQPEEWEWRIGGFEPKPRFSVASFILSLNHRITTQYFIAKFFSSKLKFTKSYGNLSWNFYLIIVYLRGWYHLFSHFNSQKN